MPDRHTSLINEIKLKVCELRCNLHILLHWKRLHEFVGLILTLTTMKILCLLTYAVWHLVTGKKNSFAKS